MIPSTINPCSTQGTHENSLRISTWQARRVSFKTETKYRLNRKESLYKEGACINSLICLADKLTSKTVTFLFNILAESAVALLYYSQWRRHKPARVIMLLWRKDWCGEVYSSKQSFRSVDVQS